MSRDDRVPNLGPHLALMLALLLAASSLLVLSLGASKASLAIQTGSPGLANPLALQPHPPIHITKDAGFNAANGIRSGSGTAADPYIISDWLFDGSLYPNSTAMMWLENTDKHVIVRNCQVIHLDTVGKQFDAFYVGKYPGENMTPIIGPPTIDLTSNVTFLDNDIDSRYGYGIQISEGSSNVLVSGNRITVHPDNVSGRDWIYGINVARGTHNVTVEDNLVNAASSLYITIGIHLSDYYVSEQRRASRLVARNNTVIDAAGGIHVESSRFTLVRDNTIYRTNLNSLAYGWPRAITVRESALNASLVHNAIRVELTGIVIGAATGSWGTYGSVTSANNTTIRDNTISNVTSGIQIGNVSGTQVINTTFANVGLQELNLNGEGGAPRNLTLTDLASPVRIRAPTEAIPIHWSWTHLAQSAEYNLSAMNGTTTVNASFATTAAGVGFVDVTQPRTNATNLTSYRLVGPLLLPNAPPTADFVWTPTSGDTSTVFTFTAQVSDDRDPPSAIQVRWDWDGDETWDTSWSTTKTAEHSFASAGDHPVVVQAMDSGGLTANISHVVSVTAPPPPPPANSPPTADFGWTPTSGDASTVFTFTAQVSDDRDPPSAIQVRWDWTGDGTWDTAWSTTKTATHSYSSTGNKAVVVQAIDSGGLTATQSHVVQVTATPPPPPPPNAPPSVDFTWTPTSGDTTTVFTFTAQVSDDHDQPSAIQVRWDWNGDGTWDTSWSTTKTATHTFSSAGDYTVVVRAIDSGGLTASKSRVVSVTAVPPPPIGTNPVSTQTQILLLLASVSTPIIIVTAIGVIVYAMNRLRRTPGRRD